MGGHHRPRGCGEARRYLLGAEICEQMVAEGSATGSMKGCGKVKCPPVDGMGVLGMSLMPFFARSGAILLLHGTL